ncbi:Gfo/Idh/MocA family oxidoreductase [Rhizobium sp. RU36D]|uniref:Gfo/Idh/MocA family protein n=1 Tax=Rhizobium sp. RU36D TaxID=1907415 RepID=UPI0009D8A835|nr:Gfo/Idh/MocA family oxidoreductase [Rhizobium sp. RU36D]SMC54523.1 Predicted dehydrogenase [Rhizobium sp. RU36D]
MTRRLNVALLGCGGIGARHADAINKLPDQMQLVACCGRDADKTAEFAARHGGEAFTDFERMLDKARPDLLVVALPPHAHSGQVEVAARAGIHLLVEKPIALTMEQAEAQVAAARDVVAACGFMYRHGAASLAWDAASRNGETGPPGHFSAQFHCNSLHAPWWRERDKAGGQMVEQLIHLIDLARHVLGRPRSVYARAANLFHRSVERYDTEDVSAIILGYDDGRIGVLHASNAAVPGRWAKQWQIVAERMTGQFTDWNNADFFTAETPPQQRLIRDDGDVFVAQLADLAAAIRDHRAPLVPLSDGAASLEIALAARRSADEGREILL